MKKRRTITASTLMVLAITTAAITPPKSQYKNLKVLPKNISSKDLNKIMVDEFTDALGVSCTFCHAEDKDTHKLDFVSDAKPEKEMARMMMRMTMKINKQYFQLKHPTLTDAALTVTCNTCHNGQPHPAEH